MPGSPQDHLTRSLDQLRKRLNGGEPRDPARHRTRDNRRIFLLGGVAAAVHWGWPEAESGKQGLQLAAERLTEPFHLPEGPRPAELEPPAKVAGKSFFTDFSEAAPLNNWSLKDATALVLEPFERRMSAVPRGPAVALPTQAMRDGRLFVDYVQQQRQAGFILRGQQEDRFDDCYRVLLTPTANAGRPELLLSARRRRRGQEIEIHRESVADLHLATLSRQLISLQLDGSDFTARLHWVEPSRFPGWPSARREVIIAHWRDDTYRDGPAGLWGVENKRGAGEFRVLTVATEV